MNQRKDSCTKSYAICTVYEDTIPTYSELFEQDCVSVEETIKDLYTVATGIKQEINMTTLSGSCLTIPSTPTTSELIQLLINEICALKVLTATQASTILTINQQILALQENQCP